MSQITFIKFILPLSIVLLLGACIHDHADHQHDDHITTPTVWQDTLHISRQTLALAGASWGMPDEQAGMEGEALFGEWVLFPEHKAIVTGIAPGRVKRIRYQLNDLVSAGAPLVDLESRDWMDLQRQYFDLIARGTFLKLEYDRLRTLQDQDATSVKAWQQIQSEYASWKSHLASVEADIRLHGVEPDGLDPAQPKAEYTLRAPISGRVTQSLVSPGQWLETGAAACALADMRQVRATLNAYPRQVASFRVGDTLWLRTDGFPGVLPARIQHVDALMATGSQTLGVHAMPLSVKDIPAVGSFVQAYQKGTISEQQLVLPETSVRMEEGRTFILVYLPDAGDEEEAVFLKRTVDVQRRSGGQVIVTRPPGLTSATPVVLEGAYYIHAHSLTQGFEHDH